MMKPTLTLLMSFALLAGAEAQEWTRFRGPNGTGVSDSKGIPVTWTEKDFRWRVELAGSSHSQPVIWGNKIFVHSATPDEGRERMLFCLNKEDGKELWSKKLTLPTHKPGNNNSGYANSSPAVDADRVYAVFVAGDQFLVEAFDHSGKQIWKENLGAFESQHGYGASPIVHDGKVIVTNDQDGQSFIVALDVKTGKTVWKCARHAMKQGTAYATPTIFERKGMATQILTSCQAHGLSGLDAKTGALLWEAKVFDKRAVSSPVLVGDLVVGTCGQGGGGSILAAVKIGGNGDVTSSNVAYSIKQAVPYVPTPIAVGERLYWVSDSGVANCAEASTGKLIWTERIAEKAVFFSSPIAIDGKLYIASKSGEVVVFAASDTFKILSRNPLGEGTFGTPCIDGDRMYVRTFTHLVCLGGK
jgi:outer membrane protein assembly factor BamB